MFHKDKNICSKCVQRVVRALVIFACLPTQQSIAQGIPEPTSIPEPKTKRYQWGFGIRTTLLDGWAMDIAGGPKHRTPNIGTDVFASYDFSPQIAIRVKRSLESSANRRLGEMYDHRSEAKRSMTVLGLIVRSPKGRPGYFCIESGLDTWDIKSTFEPLVYFKTNKNVTALLVGTESRAAYAEMGYQFFGFVKNKIIIPENNYTLEINNIGYAFVISAGIKF